MRQQTRDYLSRFLEDKKFNNVLEVGSLEVNGKVRDLFPLDQKYTGIDMRRGDGVDMVLNGHDLLTVFERDTFDLVLCFDTLEHDDMFWLTLDQMRAVLKGGGYLFVGFPTRNCPEHDHPGDYWRFMPQTMTHFFMKDYEDVWTQIDYSQDTKIEDELYCYGKKPNV